MKTPLQLFTRLSVGQKRLLNQGETLFQQGDAINNIYIVSQGKIKLSRCSVDGNPITMQLAEAGAMLAEASLFHTTYHCMAQAVTPSAELHCFDRDTLMAALESSPAAAIALLQLFAQQIRKQRTLLEIRNIRAARERIYAYLLLEADDNRQVYLPLSLKDTAHQLGLAHETMYRELKKLQEEKRLLRRGDMIEIIRLPFGAR